MPSRHIPTHAFDDILSELGDDPAIPDPQGIRKTRSHKATIPGQVDPHSSHLNTEGLTAHYWAPQLKKLAGMLPLLAGLLGLGIAFFVAFESIKSSSQEGFDSSLNQLSELKKEMVLLRNEIHEIEEDLYEEMDILEVSIHSLKQKKDQAKKIYKPQTIAYEPEIRRWRYLGNSQTGNSHRAFFQTHNGNLTFEKGVPVLGDWRLSQIEKDTATLTHPQGKSIVLNTSKGE